MSGARNNCRCYPWTGEETVELEWQDIPFYVSSAPFFAGHRPIFKKAEEIAREMEERGLKPQRPLMVLYRTGWVGGQLLIAAEKQNGDSSRLLFLREGKLVGKLYRGGVFRLSRVAREWAAELEREGKVVRDILYWYLTCPECAAGGTAEVMLIAVVSGS